MTAPHQAALRQLSEEFTAMSVQMARAARQFDELGRTLTVPYPYPYPPVPYPVAPQPVAAPVAAPAPTVVTQAPVARAVLAAPEPAEPPKVRPDQGWIGKALAIAGVAVTLFGVVLLLVLAAQAGILRPEIRVLAGAALAGALVAVGVRTNRRPGGRVGAIALTATGLAAAYMDVIALTTIYHWVPPVAGLIIAAALGGAGLTLARRWDSQQLGLLVLVPLIALAPVVSDGVTLLLIGFMIVLSAAALPVQLGKDWIWMHAARTAAVSLPLQLALLLASFAGSLGARDNPWLLGGATAVAALLAIVGALILLPHSTNRVAMAALTVVGVVPALSAGVAVDRMLAALIAAAVAFALLGIVSAGHRFPGVDGPVTGIWSALSAVAGLIAVTTAFNGYVQGPVLLGLALVLTVAGRADVVRRWIAVGFAVCGLAPYLDHAPVGSLLRATELGTSAAVSTLACSLLLVANAVAMARVWTAGRGFDVDAVRTLWMCAGVAVAYGVTMFAVTAGVLAGGTGGGFLAGHLLATICWIALAAALFVAARRMPDREAGTPLIAGGLALTAGAMAKLFLFDLGTLDGMFRVAAFIVVGLVLLGMGSGYARSLANKSAHQQP